MRIRKVLIRSSILIEPSAFNGKMRRFIEDLHDKAINREIGECYINAHKSIEFIDLKDHGGFPSASVGIGEKPDFPGRRFIVSEYVVNLQWHCYILEEALIMLSYIEKIKRFFSNARMGFQMTIYVDKEFIKKLLSSREKLRFMVYRPEVSCDSEIMDFWGISVEGMHEIINELIRKFGGSR